MTDPNRVPGMTPEEIEQAFSETVGPLTFDEQPYDIEESPVSDPTKNVPWCVHDDADRNEPCWSVLDSTGQLVVWFNYGAHYRTKTEAESLARTVAAGPDADRLRARVEQLTNTLEGERVGFRATAKALDALAPKWDQLRRLAPLCGKHGTGTGTRSGCPYCAIVTMHDALSRIDYLTGSPNEMQCSGFDVDRNEQKVMGRVERLRALAVELVAALRRGCEWTPHGSGAHAELLRRAAAILTPGEQP